LNADAGLQRSKRKSSAISLQRKSDAFCTVDAHAMSKRLPHGHQVNPSM